VRYLVAPATQIVTALTIRGLRGHLGDRHAWSARYPTRAIKKTIRAGFGTARETYRSGRLEHGAYRAKPGPRAFIAKADGRPRPLGIPWGAFNAGRKPSCV
jgi:hypothetical protein